MWMANHVIEVTSLIIAHTDTMSNEGCAKENIVFQPQTAILTKKNHKSQIDAHWQNSWDSSSNNINSMKDKERGPKKQGNQAQYVILDFRAGSEKNK